MKIIQLLLGAFLLVLALDGVYSSEDCQSESIRGKDYNGTISNIHGTECKPWTSQPANRPQYTADSFPENSLEEAKNYCRNPNNNPRGVWCYTNHTRWSWMACHVPTCNEEGWSEWGRMTRCNEPCHEAIQTRTRKCYGDSWDQPCDGSRFDLTPCNRGTECPSWYNEEGRARRKAHFICTQYGDKFPAYGFDKKADEGTCTERCDGVGKQCVRSLTVHENLKERLAQNETAIDEYPDCEATEANTCCCKN